LAPTTKRRGILLCHRARDFLSTAADTVTDLGRTPPV
jgi:hypothetical protein